MDELSKEMDAELDQDIERLLDSFNTKPTPTIRLKGDLSGDEPPKVVCDCGWEVDPDANLYRLGIAAKRHSKATGHVMRPHDTERESIL